VYLDSVQLTRKCLTRAKDANGDSLIQCDTRIDGEDERIAWHLSSQLGDRMLIHVELESFDHRVLHSDASPAGAPRQAYQSVHSTLVRAILHRDAAGIRQPEEKKGDHFDPSSYPYLRIGLMDELIISVFGVRTGISSRRSRP